MSGFWRHLQVARTLTFWKSSINKYNILEVLSAWAWNHLLKSYGPRGCCLYKYPIESKQTLWWSIRKSQWYNDVASDEGKQPCQVCKRVAAAPPPSLPKPLEARRPQLETKQPFQKQHITAVILHPSLLHTHTPTLQHVLSWAKASQVSRLRDSQSSESGNLTRSRCKNIPDIWQYSSSNHCFILALEVILTEH